MSPIHHGYLYTYVSGVTISLGHTAKATARLLEAGAGGGGEGQFEWILAQLSPPLIPPYPQIIIENVVTLKNYRINKKKGGE
jgi:hypothetical protein